MTRPHRLLLLTTLCLLAGFSTAAATTILSVSEEDLFRKSRLIFAGTVQDIKTRMSDRRDSTDVALPYTFVTFKIEKIFKGKTTSGKQITLRFRGGHAPEGRVLEVVGMPQFSVDQRYVLFVRENPEQLCPLKGWKQGSFRVIKKDVFTHDGQSVWRLPDGGMTRGPVDEQYAAAESAPGGKRMVPAKAGNDVAGDASKVSTLGTGVPKDARRMDYRAFASYLSSQVKRFNTPEELKKLEPVVSADFAARFYVPRPKGVAPPARQ